MEICPLCNKECNSLKLHHWKAHTEKGQAHKPRLGQAAWNKDLSYEDAFGKEKAKELKQIQSDFAKTNGRPHSEETKKKISEIRKQYLKDHPEEVPYLLNHFSHGLSYPERYFIELFDNENIFLIDQYRVKNYCLDFACPEKKFYIEIDGNQHYCDEKIIQSDIRRTEFLSDLGWKGLRIRWSIWMKKTLLEKAYVIEEIKQILRS